MTPANYERMLATAAAIEARLRETLQHAGLPGR